MAFTAVNDCAVLQRHLPILTSDGSDDSDSSDSDDDNDDDYELPSISKLVPPRQPNLNRTSGMAEEAEDIRNREWEILTLLSRRWGHSEPEYLVRWAPCPVLEKDIRPRDGVEYVCCDGIDYIIKRGELAAPEEGTNRPQRIVEWKEDFWRPKSTLMRNASEFVEEYDERHPFHPMESPVHGVSIDEDDEDDEQAIVRSVSHSQRQEAQGMSPMPQARNADYTSRAREMLWSSRLTEKKRELLALREKNRIAIRSKHLAKGGNINIKECKNANAVLVYACGVKQPDPCEGCKSDLGPFQECVVLPKFFDEVCANCIYRGCRRECLFWRYYKNGRAPVCEHGTERQEVLALDDSSTPQNSSSSSIQSADGSSIVVEEMSYPSTDPSSPFEPITPTSDYYAVRERSLELGTSVASAERRQKLRHAAVMTVKTTLHAEREVTSGAAARPSPSFSPPSSFAGIAFEDFVPGLESPITYRERSRQPTVDALKSRLEKRGSEQPASGNSFPSRNVTPAVRRCFSTPGLASEQRLPGIDGMAPAASMQPDAKIDDIVTTPVSTYESGTKRKALTALSPSTQNERSPRSILGSFKAAKKEPGLDSPRPEVKVNLAKRVMSPTSSPRQSRGNRRIEEDEEMLTWRSDHPACPAGGTLPCKDKTVGYAAVLAAEMANGTSKAVYDCERFAWDGKPNDPIVSDAQMHFILAQLPCSCTQYLQDAWDHWVAVRKEEGEDPWTKETFISWTFLKNLNWLVSRYCPRPPEQIDLTLD